MKQPSTARITLGGDAFHTIASSTSHGATVMAFFNGRYRVASARLPGWDYTIGWYFVTVCTQGRRPAFGAVVNGVVQLSVAGAIAAEEWQRTAAIRPNVTIDAWVVMPDHFHGIIAIHDRGAGVNDGADVDAEPGANVETPRRGVSTVTVTSSPSPTTASSSPPSSPRPTTLRAGSLGAIVGQWKSVVTKQARASGYPDFAWQTRFYDVIVRDDRSLDVIRRYIANNPRCYAADRRRATNVWM
jgi:putative transposase